MSESLKSKAISGAKWNWLYNIGSYFISFFLSIILARLLEPCEFGILGMLNIFTAVAMVFINSGFTSALIRENKSSDADFSTIFYYNIVVSHIFYLVLFFTAPLIADFYNEPKLIILTRLVSLVFLINSFGIVQNAILVRELNFKKQTVFSLIGLFVSVIISIIMAFNGYGVFSIVAQVLSQAIVTNLLLWFYADWKPKGGFNKVSFKRLWKFASQILATNIIIRVIDNIDSILIGKIFSATNLGYYVRAKSTKQIPEQILVGTLNTTAFAILSKINQDEEKFRTMHLKLFNLCVYGFFPVAFGLIGISKSFTILIYSAKWIPAVPILQTIALTSIPLFLEALFMQTIMAKGEGKVYFKLNAFKKLIGLLTIPFGLFWGLYPFLFAYLFISFVGLLLNIYFTSKLIQISKKKYIITMLLPLLMSLIMLTLVLFTSKLNIQSHLILLIIQLIIGFLTYTILSILFKVKEFWTFKLLLFEQMKNLRTRFTKK